MLKIFEENPVTNSIEEKSEEGDYTSPIVFNPNGDLGDTIERKLYLQNDDDTKYYTNVSAKPTPSELVSRGNPKYPLAPFKVKLLIQEAQPTKSEWESLEPGNTASFGNIGSLGTPDTSLKTFWVRVETPANLRIGESRDISFEITSTGHDA